MMSKKLDALREFLSHHLTLRGLEEVEGYLEHFIQLEAENEALRVGLAETKAVMSQRYQPKRVGEMIDALLTGEDE